MQQFEITKMLMLIFSVIVMCSYLFQCVCFVNFETTHISRNTIQWLLPNIPYAQYSITLRNLKNIQYFNIAPMEKEWFMTPMEYSPNGKNIIATIEYTPWFIAQWKRYGFTKDCFLKR